MLSQSKVQKERVASRSGETESDPRRNSPIGHRYTQCFVWIQIVLMTEIDIEKFPSLI